MPMLSDTWRPTKAEISEFCAPVVAHQRIECCPDVHAPARLPTPIDRVVAGPSRGEHSVREAALSIFCDPLPCHCFRLQNLSGREWRRLLYWLDISGLALYFLERIIELQFSHWLPASVLGRLEQNLADNTERTSSMIMESIEIQERFQKAQLSYAVLKGLSLWPNSVTRPELRSQFDLDFLVAEESAPEARRILERRGYRLYAVSGRSWEFKLNEKPCRSLKDLYKDLPSHLVELHLDTNIPGRTSPLQRTERREFQRFSMPVLSPVDLFLGQGLHAYKHTCGEFSRVAHLLEFRRHVLARRDDHAFWNELQTTAGTDPRAILGLGVVTMLITHVMGGFAPERLTGWTVQCLPRPARLWVEMYGRRAVFGSFPGSKLYLLLQRELEAAGVPAKRSLRQILLPARLPPPVVMASPNETLRARVARYRMQFYYIQLRLRFHIVEGFRYAWESHRWRRHINRVAP